MPPERHAADEARHGLLHAEGTAIRDLAIVVRDSQQMAGNRTPDLVAMVSDTGRLIVVDNLYR